MMDERKTKAQLIAELAALRRIVSDPASTDAQRSQVDGRLHESVERLGAFEVGDGPGLVHTDVSRLRRAHQRAEHQNRVLRVIRDLKQLIVREKNPEVWIRRAGEILIETRGYTSALLVHTDGTPQPGIVAHSVAGGACTQVSEDAIRKNGLTACMKQALESTGPVIVEHDTPDCGDCWLHSHHHGRQRLVNGLVHDGRSYGVISVALPEDVSLDAEEVDLFAEIGGDVAFALHAIDRDKKRQRVEQDNRLANRILQHLNRSLEEDDDIRQILTMIQDYGGFEAVGIRLRDGEDFPYSEVKGFPASFVEAERYLCRRDRTGELVRDSGGAVVLECMCGNVICGRTDSEYPFFTEGGSFWTNSTTALLATATEEERLACPRHRCSGDGYESVALIPLRSGDETIGLLQLNDHRRDRFTLETIELIEEICASIGIALARSQSREALNREKIFTQLLVDTAQTIILVLDAEGRIVQFNPYLEQLSGYRLDDVRGKDWFDTFLPAADRAPVRKLFRSAFSGIQTRGNINPIVTRDGDERQIEWFDITIKDTAGVATHVLSTGQDVTERLRTEKELKRREALLSSALQMARAGHWEYDVGRDRFTFNDNFYRIFRTTAANVGGYEMSSADYARRFCHPDDADVVNLEARAAIESTDSSYDRQIEHRILYADGEVGHITVRFLIEQDAEGRTVRTYGVNQDITERKEFQAQIAQSDRLASLGMLAAGVAHEINNPLAYVLYNLESLAGDLPKLSSALRKSLDIIVERVGNDEWARLMGKDQALLNPSMLDDMRARFEDALQGSRRIEDVARGLGTFSRVERDRLVPVVLMHVIEAAINLVLNEIKFRARLIKEYGKTSTIMANDGRLSQVFLNLLINAVHAISEGDVEGNEIRVRTWQEGDEVFAEVSDTGKGISAEDLTHLFEPFFTTKVIGVGTGLGLSISKAIVEDYGGRIEVKSEVGKGTRFVVRLPVKKVEAQAAVTPRGQPLAQPDVRGRILVIDDEAGIRAVMVRLLMGHEVVEAATGAEARKILEADQAFDLILCDVMMPAMSGVELHEWLSRAHPDLANRVVFITGGTFTPKAQEYLAKVGNIKLEKPFDADSLAKIVSERIGARSRSD